MMTTSVRPGESRPTPVRKGAPAPRKALAREPKTPTKIGNALKGFLTRFHPMREKKGVLRVKHDCKPIVILRNVSAVITPDGHMGSEDRRKGIYALAYAKIVHCGSPTCEKVFEAVLADTEAQIAAKVKGDRLETYSSDVPNIWDR